VGLTFRNGTYLGDCLVHCDEEISVGPETVAYALTSRVPDARNPDVHAEAPSPPGAWEALERAFEPAALRALPATIGLPDAADAGGEFLEVTEEEATTRVDFPRAASVPEVAPLLDALRELRAQLAADHRG
jgi:hypothetical protein